MAKISRPIVYSVVGAAVVYAIVVLTQPDAPVAKHKVHITSHAHTSADAFTDEDLNAHFTRYAVSARNPFLPALVLGKDVVKPKAVAPATPGGWALTGINVINGVPNALLENGKTSDSVFLQPGDRWQGLRVLGIGADAVTFVNALGQQTHLGFRAEKEIKPDGAGPNGSPFHLPPGVGPLPPMPVGPGNMMPGQMPPMGGR